MIRKCKTKLKQGYYIFLSGFANWFFRKLEIKDNKIVCENFLGKGYGDNPKYLADELYKRNSNFDIVWLVKDKKLKVPSYVRKVRINSFTAMYELATAKLWIDNVRNSVKPLKKHEQIYLQTWHAPFSVKRIEGDAEDKLSKSYLKEAKYDGSICDAIIVNSKLQEEQFKRAFWLNEKTEILKYGLPRNDYLAISKNNKNEYIYLRDKYGFSKDDVYILYAPTFRDDFSTDGYALDYNGVLSAFEKKTEKKCHIVVRFHPNVPNKNLLLSFSERILDGNMIPNIQELSILCDFVISDYSTSVFDFALLNKVVFICALDLEHYREIRGLLPEFNTLPFPKGTTNEELISLIENFEKKVYQEQVDTYFRKYPAYDTGEATKKITDWILKKLGT